VSASFVIFNFVIISVFYIYSYLKIAKRESVEREEMADRPCASCNVSVMMRTWMYLRNESTLLQGQYIEHSYFVSGHVNDWIQRLATSSQKARNKSFNSRCPVCALKRARARERERERERDCEESICIPHMTAMCQRVHLCSAVGKALHLWEPAMYVFRVWVSIYYFQGYACVWV
jgi:hypothetical protein